MELGAPSHFTMQPFQKNIPDDMSNTFLIQQRGVKNQMTFIRDFLSAADTRVKGVG